jgi:gluconolactonase
MTEREVLAEGLACPEGPDFLDDGRVIFVETFRCRVSSWSDEAGVRPFADVGGAPNAALRGTDGVYVAQHGSSAGSWRSPRPTPAVIQKIRDDGTVEVTIASADGRPLVGPNDLCFGPDDCLYFTDPGAFDPDHPEEGQLCVAEPNGTAHVLERVGPTYPNGIVVEPDGSVVWNESYTRQIRRRRPDGAVELVTTLPEGRVPDGMKLATDGRLFMAGVTSGGIDVIAPDGELLGFIDTRGAPQNCVFAGSDLYVTDYGRPGSAGHPEGGEIDECGWLLRFRVDAQGQELRRGAIQPQNGGVNE